jgi:hypothetical protein
VKLKTLYILNVFFQIVSARIITLEQNYFNLATKKFRNFDSLALEENGPKIGYA